MTRYAYKTVPAPTRGLKASGVKSSEARFAHAIETTINEWAAEGWEYLRADTLPHEERQGLTGSATTFRTLLVFRRAVETSAMATAHIDEPVEPVTPVTDPAPVTRTLRAVPSPTSNRESDEDAIVTPKIYASDRQDEDEPNNRN